MVTILVIAHSEIANSLISCAEHILAKRVANLYIVPVKKTEDTEYILNKTKEFISKVGSGQEILILTDLFGATPSNIAARLVKKGQVELITGVNMPMLIRAIAYANRGLKLCIEKAVDGGKNGIIHLANEVNEHGE